jgi:hypothetical protein
MKDMDVSRFAAGEIIEYTSFDPSGYSVGQVVRYDSDSGSGNPLVYIRSRSGSRPFPVRESQIRHYRRTS